MKINRGIETVTIVHPNFPEVKVHTRRLARLELIEYYNRVEQSNHIPIPVKDSDGNYLYKEDGDIQVVYQNIFDTTLILDMLGKSITGWEGIQDENDKDIPYNRKNLDVLFEPALDVAEKEDKPRMSFWAYLLEEMKTSALGADANKSLDSK